MYIINFIFFFLQFLDDPKKPNTPKVVANGTVTDKSKDGKDGKKQQVNGTIANKDSKVDNPENLQVVSPYLFLG